MSIATLATKSDWKRRVASTVGHECLCDANWRFLAVSEAIRAKIGEANLVGRSLKTMPLYHSYVGMLSALPLFEGKLRVVQCCSEFWRDGHAHARDTAFWPVLTNEDEFLVHIVKNPRTARRAAEFQGFRITELRIVMLDGSELGAESSTVTR